MKKNEFEQASLLLISFVFYDGFVKLIGFELFLLVVLVLLLCAWLFSIWMIRFQVVEHKRIQNRRSRRKEGEGRREELTQIRSLRQWRTMKDRNACVCYTEKTGREIGGGREGEGGRGRGELKDTNKQIKQMTDGATATLGSPMRSGK